MLRRVLVSSVIGTAVEWYDFFLYATASALVFGKLFFPTFDPLTGTIAAFGTFAIGYLARPVGAVVFGHFRDRIGRKATLVATRMIMGVATFIIGILPTYETIGVWAPVLLVAMRFCQGLGVGGEWGGAVLLFVAIFGFAFFPLIETGDTRLIIIAYMLGMALSQASVYAVQSTWFAELFGTRVRYTGASLPYQLAGIITSGPAPLISTWLFASYHSTWPIAVYIAITALVSLACAWFLPETYRRDLSADPTHL